MVNNMIKKEFNKTLTKKDFLYYLIHRNTFILTTPLIFIALIIAFVFVIKKDGFQTFDLIYLIPIVLFIFIFIKMYFSISKAVNNNNVEIKITSEIYSETCEGKTTSLELKNFNSYSENKNYLYLFVDKINALILPKREFNFEELDKIKTYFSTSLKRNSNTTLKNILNVILSLLLIVCIVVLLIALFK